MAIRVDDLESYSETLLKGSVILRFAHAFASGAGVEQYLADVDRALLERNELIIVRMYISEDFQHERILEQRVGKGVLIKIPMDAGSSAKKAYARSQEIRHNPVIEFKKLLRDWVGYNRLLYNMFFRRIIRKRTVKDRGMVVYNAEDLAKRCFDTYDVNLLVMHHVGSSDSGAFIDEALRRNVPYVYIHHFANERLNHISVRAQLERAHGIGGVSGVGVPRWLMKRFVNVSDGIDMEMFKPESGKRTGLDFDTPVTILPARIIPTKGQADLIRAAAVLKREGLRVKVVLAGRGDSDVYQKELEALSASLSVENDVLFVGELDQEELRDWYAVSSIMAFPTYHHEGLPRVLMETQAMEVPPIVYRVGGTPEGVENGKTGYLVRKGDVISFTERMKELLSDHQKRKRMGERGRHFVEKHFSLEALASRHKEFYSSALNEEMHSKIYNMKRGK